DLELGPTDLDLYRHDMFLLGRPRAARTVCAERKVLGFMDGQTRSRKPGDLCLTIARWDSAGRPRRSFSAVCSRPGVLVWASLAAGYVVEQLVWGADAMLGAGPQLDFDMARTGRALPPLACLAAEMDARQQSAGLGDRYGGFWLMVPAITAGTRF